MMLPISWQENCNGNFIKQNNKSKAIILLLSIVFVLFFTQLIYAKYVINQDFEIKGNSAGFYFDIKSNETSEKINSYNYKAEFDLIIKNNDNTNYNVFDTTYEIELLNNDKYTFSVGSENATNGKLRQILKGNELLNENKKITIVPKDNSAVGLVEELKIKIKVKGPYVDGKEYNFPITIIENKEYGYDYSGKTETFTAPMNGKYKVELWGAEGGAYSGPIADGSNISITSGKGAYTSGIIELAKDENLNVTIGGKGSSVPETETLTAGGFNGGGGAYFKAGTGGGATDIRYGGTSLNDRIMVAAGAGGTAVRATVLIGGAGGTFTGIDGGNASNEEHLGMHAGRGGTQIAGGLPGELWTGELREERYPGIEGSFGNGGNGGYELSYADGAGAGGRRLLWWWPVVVNVTAVVRVVRRLYQVIKVVLQ